MSIFSLFYGGVILPHERNSAIKKGLILPARIEDEGMEKDV
jgi:hypothetical protein